jgi:hypothetical protein
MKYNIYVSSFRNPKGWQKDYYKSYDTLGEAKSVVRNLEVKYQFVEIIADTK